MANAENPMKEPPDGLVAFTAHTIVSWEEWEDTLAKVRKDGYATNIEELEHGYAAVAAPVRDQTGHTVAAISIGGPIHRIGKDRIVEFVKNVRAATLCVSERLGYRSENEKP